MGYVIIGCLLAGTVLLLIYDLRFANKRRRKLTAAVDAVFTAIAAASVLYAVFANISYKDDKDNYDIIGDDVVGAVRYMKTENDHYIFSRSQIMSPAELIAVPKSAAEPPSLSVVYPYVIICSQWGAESYDADFPSGKCQVMTGVVKMRTEHIGFAFLTSMFSASVMFIYNLIVFIRTFADRRKAARENSAGGSDK